MGSGTQEIRKLFVRHGMPSWVPEFQIFFAGREDLDG
jgi:hypothetical protein